jgi:hypothetical protein
VKAGRGTRNAIDLSERAAETHSISCNMPSETQVKIICTSSQNDEFYPDDEGGNPLDEIFKIGFVADNTMVNGTYTITAEGVDFVLKPGAADVPAYCPATKPTCQLTVTGGQTELTIPLTISSAGVSTFILPFDAQLPDGVEAFKCTGVVNGEVKTEQMMQLEAGVPVLVVGNAGTYSFTGAPTVTTNECTVGVLTGVLADKQVSSGYVMQMLNGDVGFYQIDPEKPLTIPAYKCYLTVSGEARSLLVNFGDATVIDRLNANAAEGDWYDLSGRRTLTKPTGVYIQRGKKLFVK